MLVTVAVLVTAVVGQDNDSRRPVTAAIVVRTVAISSTSVLICVTVASPVTTFAGVASAVPPDRFPVDVDVPVDVPVSAHATRSEPDEVLEPADEPVSETASPPPVVTVRLPVEVLVAEEVPVSAHCARNEPVDVEDPALEPVRAARIVSVPLDELDPAEVPSSATVVPDGERRSRSRLMHAQSTARRC